MKALWVALWLLMGTIAVRASSAAESFEAANRLYEEGKFKEAAAAYEQLAAAGRVSSELYFNLGNAWFKAGQLGRAVAAYHQAGRLAPRDPDVRANLQFARNQTPGPSRPQGGGRSWLGRLSLDEWALAAAAALWASFLLLAAGQWRPALKPTLRTPVIAAGVAALATLACLGTALQQQRSARLAVVVKPEAVVRQGPLEVSKTAFAVHDGAELDVLDQKNDWLQVSAGPARLGWIRRDQVLLVR